MSQATLRDTAHSILAVVALSEWTLGGVMRTVLLKRSWCTPIRLPKAPASINCTTSSISGMPSRIAVRACHSRE